jgi:putative membrane protein
MVKPTDLIDPADRLRIEAAILSAQRETHAEIVVVVVRASAAYAIAGWRLGVVLALIGFFGVASLDPGAPLFLFPAVQVAGLLLGLGLARSDPVRRHLVPTALADTRTHDRALCAFAENGLTRTAGRAGLLIFVSLLEHRTIVLADEGIERVRTSDESWDGVIGLVVAGLRDGRPAEGLVGALGRCGEILSRRLPAPARGPDELSVALVLEE